MEKTFDNETIEMMKSQARAWNNPVLCMTILKGIESDIMFRLRMLRLGKDTPSYENEVADLRKELEIVYYKIEALIEQNHEKFKL